jgi:hypothetical protein
VLFRCRGSGEEKIERQREYAEECDESDNVICSWYERRWETVSLIRTCQEPIV